MVLQLLILTTFFKYPKKDSISELSKQLPQCDIDCVQSIFKSLSETLDEYSESLDANENNSLVVYQSHSSLNYLHSVMR